MSAAPFSKISERIRAYRSLRKKTQVALAGEASIDYRHFQKLEAGQSDFKISTIFKLADALNVPPCHLLENDPILSNKGPYCTSSLSADLGIGLVLWNQEGHIIYINEIFAGWLNADVSGQPMGWKFFVSEDICSKLTALTERTEISGLVRFNATTRIGINQKFVLRWAKVQRSGFKGCAAAVWLDEPITDINTLPER